MNKQKQRAGRFLQKLCISLATLALVFSNLLQMPVVKAAASTPTWTADTSGTTNYLHGITYGNGKWAAVGSGKTILTSSDGIHWSSGNTNGVNNSELQRITYGGSTWWMIDSSGHVFSTTNISDTSRNWAETNSGASAGVDIAACSSCAVKAVMVDGTAFFEYSATSGWSPGHVASGPDTVIYADGKYVVGGAGQIQSSTDGVNWLPVSLTGGDIIDSITYSRGQFVAVGADQHVTTGVVYTSPDGITWTKQSVSVPIFNSVAGSGNGYIAVGNNGLVYSSPDGITWIKQSSGTTQNLNQVYYAGGRYVAVGDNGTIITQSSNANLASLSLSNGTLSPSFSPSTTGYTVSTADSSISVTASVYDNASFTVDGSAVTSGSSSGPIALTQKSNTIPIVVTAQDGMTQKTYTLTVNRIPPPTVTGLQHSNVTQTGWTESWGTVTGATSYNVYLGGKNVGTVTQATYSFANVQPGTTYSVAIAAVNDLGQTSAQSTADSVTTLANVSGVPTHSNVTQTGWTESWGPVTGATSYDVYLNNKPVGTVTQAVYNFTGEQPGTTYQVQVSSVNGSGQASALSAPDSVTTSVYGPTPPTIITEFFPEPARVGQAYFGQVRVIGGMMPMKWSVTTGALPPGLTLSNQGVISGTPTSAGSYTFSVRVTDSNDLASSRKLTIVVEGSSTLSIKTTTVVPTGQPGQPFGQTLTADGGNPPYKWSIVKGTLPSGLKLNSSTGVVSGITTQKNPEILTVEVQDATGMTRDKQVVIDSLPTNEREIVWQTPSLAAENVPAITGSDSGTQTTYMPIWYVMQLLKPLGIQSTWDGKYWHMTTTAKADLSNVQAGNGNTGIYLNGTLLQNVDTVAAKDPSTGKATTYMPIWYVMQLLKRVGLHSAWNGTTWTVTN